MTNTLNANSQLNWQTNSWRKLPIKQQPQYSNADELRKVEAELANFPPLVAIDEIEKLKTPKNIIFGWISAKKFNLKLFY